jgi:hypothetical protein
MRSRIIWLARKVSTRRGAIGTSTPVAHMLENLLDEPRGVGTRQTHFAMQ